MIQDKGRVARRVLGVAVLLAAAPAWAGNWAERTQIHGFITFQGSISNEPTYWLAPMDGSGIARSGGLYGSRVGFNITSQVGERVDVVVQLISRAEEEGFNTHADWAFVNVGLGEGLFLRVGKNKYPVGIVNEYVDVGTAYPWIKPPLAIYSTNPEGPQATRSAYQGALLGWSVTPGDGDWTFELDGYGGEVDLEHVKVKRVLGLTGKANWNDEVQFQLSAYQGEMAMDTSDPGMAAMAAMNGRSHSAVVGGVKVERGEWLLYAEAAQIRMDYTMGGRRAGDSDSWYVTVGRQFGDWLPHFTQQSWQRGNGNGHDISTLGLNYAMNPQVVWKGELSFVSTDGDGLYESTPTSDSARVLTLAINVTF